MIELHKSEDGDAHPQAESLGAGPISARPLHILIVEDDEGVSRLLSGKLASALEEEFPGVRISRTGSRQDAERIIAMEEPPDATVLDLVLTDSTLEQTIGVVKAFEKRTAVVIITGHRKEKVEELLLDSAVEVVEKTPGMWGSITRAVVRAILRKNRLETERDHELCSNLLKVAMRKAQANAAPQT